MSLQKKIMEGFKLYSLALLVTLTVILMGTLLYATLTNKPFLDTLRSTLIIGVIALTAVGFVSGLPLSEYSYIRAGALNPAIMREGERHARRRREPRKLGIILGIVGLTLLVIYFLISP